MLLAFDLETTGLCPDSCVAIEIGAVLFDPLLEEPVIDAFSIVLDCEKAIWESKAKEMNQWYFSEKNKVGQDAGWLLFSRWLESHYDGRFNLCGANVQGFDRQFIPDYIKEDLLSMRALDIGSYFYNGAIMSLDQLCMDYLGHSCGHRALQDAMDTAKLVSMRMGGFI